MNIFRGMKILWIFFFFFWGGGGGSSQNLTSLLIISMHFRVFFKIKVQKWDTFGGC